MVFRPNFRLKIWWVFDFFFLSLSNRNRGKSFYRLSKKKTQGPAAATGT